MFILYFLLRVLPFVAIISLLLYGPVYFMNKKEYGKRPFIRHLSIYVFIGVLLSLLYATILIDGFDITFNPGYHLLNLIPFVWISENYEMGFAKMIQQLLMNIVMVIPVGFIIPIVFENTRKWWKTVLWIILIITSIETIQYFIGRSADVDDLIMNTIGGLIGYSLFALLDKCICKKIWWKKALEINE